MKKIALILIIIGNGFALAAQTTIDYVYDNVGNRVLRHVVVIQNKNPCSLGFAIRVQ